jgi:hypothetical protein
MDRGLGSPHIQPGGLIILLFILLFAVTPATSATPCGTQGAGNSL